MSNQNKRNDNSSANNDKPTKNQPKNIKNKLKNKILKLSDKLNPTGIINKQKLLPKNNENISSLLLNKKIISYLIPMVTINFPQALASLPLQMQITNCTVDQFLTITMTETMKKFDLGEIVADDNVIIITNKTSCCDTIPFFQEKYQKLKNDQETLQKIRDNIITTLNNTRKHWLVNWILKIIKGKDTNRDIAKKIAQIKTKNCAFNQILQKNSNDLILKEQDFIQFLSKICKEKNKKSNDQNTTPLNNVANFNAKKINQCQSLTLNHLMLKATSFFH